MGTGERAAERSCLVSITNEILYIDRPIYSKKVLLKVGKVLIQNGHRSMETYAVLDDGSERTIILHSAAQKLKLHGSPEDSNVLHGAAVSFMVSSAAEPQQKVSDLWGVHS